MVSKQTTTDAIHLARTVYLGNPILIGNCLSTRPSIESEDL
jgi:hypothetical protein